MACIFASPILSNVIPIKSHTFVSFRMIRLYIVHLQVRAFLRMNQFFLKKTSKKFDAVALRYCLQDFPENFFVCVSS